MSGRISTARWLVMWARGVNVVSNDWAFLRSTSHGTVTTLADGATLPGKSQELSVLRRVEGHWKLARYSFSSTLQPA
jgi:hypothetical protein